VGDASLQFSSVVLRLGIGFVAVHFISSLGLISSANNHGFLTINEQPENSWRLNTFYSLGSSFASAHNNVLELHQKCSVDFWQK